MKEEILASVKRPAVLVLASGASCAAIVFAWLQFPSFVPLAVLIILGTITAVTAIVAEVIVLLRFARIARLGQQPPTEIRNLPKWAVIGFVLLLILGNAVLLALLRLNAWDLLAANFAFVLSCFAAWSLATGRIHRETNHNR